MPCPDPGPAARALVAAGTASYDSADFAALGKVPDSLAAVVATLTGLGFGTAGGAPGYHLDPVLSDLRAAVRQAAASSPVVVVYYTGHGAHPELDTYYLVGRASQPGDFNGTALAAEDLPVLLTRRGAAGEVPEDQPHALVILDCCYSGRAGMEMLGEALRGVGNPRVWVIASAGALEYARQGEFAAAFCDALERPTTGPSTQFLSLESVVQAVNDARAGRSGQEARVFLPATGSAGIPPFFPNKHYRPGLAGLTVSEQHWLSRARGAPQESTTGFYLTGRTGRIRAAEDLIGWMTGPGQGGLAVVTGSPGTGKSTLLALPVLLTQPARRAELLAGSGAGSLTERAAALLPADTPLAAVHARGLNADQAARVIAEALGLVPGSAATLLQDLEASPRPGALVVVDALDEAVSPPEMAADLLLPLGQQAGLRVAVGGRRHAVPDGAQLTIDLDRRPYQDPEALADYLRRLLAATEEPGIRTPYQAVPDEVTAAVAAVIAQRATSGDGRTESFLIGRILALSVRGRPEPADVTSPGWQSGLPAELTEAFDEDLARLGDRTPVARALLEALAWAQGPGLPWENIWVPVARALAGPGGQLITNDDVRWLLDEAGAYVVEDLGPGQRSVFRPFHDVLAAYLRGEPADPGPDGPGKTSLDDAWLARRLEIEDVITNALLATVPVDAAGEPQWDSAHPYLQTYLMRHAADAGSDAASSLAGDEGFLAVTDRVTFSPYRGLLPFDESSAPLFFGRDAETAHLVGLLSAHSGKPGPLMVSGVSGVGKSSLLRAGLLPALAAGRLPVPGSAGWPRIVMTPGSTPMLELAVRIALLAGTGTAALMTALRADPAQITAMIRQALLTVASRAAQPPGRLVIVVDQFEQIFTQCADERERRAFIGALSAAARTTGTEPPQAMVVLAVRADFETRCSEYAELADAVQNRYLVPSMTPSGLRQAIVAPVQAAGSRIDAGLVEILLRDAAEPSGTAVALPLVSYALDQTWRGRSGEDLTVDDYIRVGGISSAIAASADSCYDGLTPSQQAMARLLFMRLTALNARGEPAAHPVSRAELAESMPAGDAEDLSAVIGAFTDQRLLTLGDGMIIISHEVLLSAWPRLRAWLSGSQAGLIIRTRLIESATDWASSGRDPAYLYRGSLLDSAWAASARIDANQLPLSRRERDFLDASMRARRRSVRRRRMIIALLILVIIVLVAQNIVILLSR